MNTLSQNMKEEFVLRAISQIDSKYIWLSKAVLLLWIFYVFVLSCVCYVLCASVYMCFVVTCWERADLLALVCSVFCEFVTFPLVSWVRCGTWLYRFLIFAPLLTFFDLRFLGHIGDQIWDLCYSLQSIANYCAKYEHPWACTILC